MKAKRTQASDADKALTLMFEVGRIIRHAMIVSETVPFPLSYIETLRFVEEQKNPTMRDVAAYLRIAAPTATAMIEFLVNEGYLARKEDAVDRRLVRLSLSAKGKSMLSKTVRARLEALRGMIGTLNAADRKEFIRILSKIVKK